MRLDGKQPLSTKKIAHRMSKATTRTSRQSDGLEKTEVDDRQSRWICRPNGNQTHSPNHSLHQGTRRCAQTNAEESMPANCRRSFNRLRRKEKARYVRIRKGSHLTGKRGSHKVAGVLSSSMAKLTTDGGAAERRQIHHTELTKAGFATRPFSARESCRTSLPKPASTANTPIV